MSIAFGFWEPVVKPVLWVDDGILLGACEREVVQLRIVADDGERAAPDGHRQGLQRLVVVNLSKKNNLIKQPKL